jgi:hypothetical protein
MRHSGLTFFVLALAAAYVTAQDRALRPLIIDVHLHAHTLSMYGKPLPSPCANDQEILFPGWDPREPLTFEHAKSCPAKLKAPGTDDELIRLHVLHHAREKPLYGHWMIAELRRHGY